MASTKTALVVVLAAAALAPAACSGGGNGGGGNGENDARETSAAEETQPDETTTEAAPPPLTAAEERWHGALMHYQTRFEREAFRGGRVTHGSMRRQARLFRDCSKAVRGDPGRFAPAARPARAACRRLEMAARLLDEAIAASDPGGTVVVGTAEAARFDRALGRAGEATGNAQFDLRRARQIASDLNRELQAG